MALCQEEAMKELNRRMDENDFFTRFDSAITVQNF
jgi:hypothetical protein